MAVDRPHPIRLGGVYFLGSPAPHLALFDYEKQT